MQCRLDLSVYRLVVEDETLIASSSSSSSAQKFVIFFFSSCSSFLSHRHSRQSDKTRKRERKEESVQSRFIDTHIEKKNVFCLFESKATNHLSERNREKEVPKYHISLLILDTISTAMTFLLNATPILALLLAMINCVSAEVYYVGPTVGGILGLVSLLFTEESPIDMNRLVQIILILDIIAAVEILRSGKTMVEKLLWILFIVFCPLIGKKTHQMSSNRSIDRICLSFFNRSDRLFTLRTKSFCWNLKCQSNKC